MLMKALLAKWMLAWALVKRVLLGFFPVGDHGPRPWLRRLRREQLTATAESSWPRQVVASRCLVCGLCDVLGEPGERPSRWVAALAREPSCAPLALSEANRLRILAPSIARMCPAQVGVAELAALIDANAALLADGAETDL